MPEEAPETDPTARRRPTVVPHDASLPPAAPGTRYVPVVLVGIVIADDHLRAKVRRRFHWPMIVLALAVLPLLIIELISPPQGWLRELAAIGFAVIWVAFVLEFIVKVAIAESRFEYVKRNWLDLIIIAVPVLRVLRAQGAIVRTARVFKLRGVGMKVVRHLFTFIIGLEATDRMMRRFGIRSKGRPDPEKMTRYQLIDEVKRRRRLTDAWERWYDEHEAHVESHGGPCYVGERPTPDTDLQSAPCASPSLNSIPSSETSPATNGASATPSPAPSPPATPSDPSPS